MERKTAQKEIDKDSIGSHWEVLTEKKLPWVSKQLVDVRGKSPHSENKGLHLHSYTWPCGHWQAFIPSYECVAIQDPRKMMRFFYLFSFFFVRERGTWGEYIVNGTAYQVHTLISALHYFYQVHTSPKFFVYHEWGNSDSVKWGKFNGQKTTKNNQWEWSCI